jgi:hypothetical protein
VPHHAEQDVVAGGEDADPQALREVGVREPLVEEAGDRELALR